MKLYSTNNRNLSVSFKEALMKGIAEDGGLFMPNNFPHAGKEFWDKLPGLSFNELAFEISNLFLKDEIPQADIKNIIDSGMTFDSPLVGLDDTTGILELFHGPTLAFKDFGARFMANMMSYINRESKKKITILVATSGDTGSAVASGYYKVEGINVVLLYPSKKVSKIQEQQLTTLGENISALEVDGTFDDCQRLVKQAFPDREISEKMTLSSANSINIGRLLPQSFYYFRAYAQLKDKSLPLIISVPSGNFGNLTAGLFAKKLGLPVYKYIAATNANDVFPQYLKSGRFKVKPSVATLSNAMDVGNPSNLARIQALYNNEVNLVRQNIYSESFTDEQTAAAIGDVYNRYGYVIDPHGAVGFIALQNFIKQFKLKKYNGVVLETAHPAKFADIVKDIIDKEIKIPKQLAECMKKQKHSVKISSAYIQLKEFLLDMDNTH